MQSIRRRVVMLAAVALTTTALACSDTPSAPSDAGQGQETKGKPTTGGQAGATAAGLSVTPGVLVLKVGAVGQMTAALVDAAGAVVEVPSGALPWTSSNTAVATVSGTGAVTAVGSGEATISVTAGGFTGSARVAVTP